MKTEQTCAWLGLGAGTVLSVAGFAHAQEAKTPAEPQSPASAAAASDAAMGKIIAPDAKPVAIVTGLKFSEGPVWVAGHSGQSPYITPVIECGYLLFSDIPSDTVFKWTPGPASSKAAVDLVESKPTEFLKPSGFSNGLAIDQHRLTEEEARSVLQQGGPQPGPARWLLLAQHSGKVSRQLIGSEPAKVELIASKFEDKSLSSPNDLVAKSDGSIYFTDPPYGVRGSLGPGGRQKELDFSGIYRVDAAGKLTLLHKGMPTPNGLAFSPDEKTLYVADTSKGEIRSFGVKDDGTLDDGKLFAAIRVKNDKGEERPGGGDGVKVDVEGNVYCAARGGVWVFAPSGEKIGVIALPASPTNLCFGGPDRKTLFMTSASAVYGVPVKIAGHSWMK